MHSIKIKDPGDEISEMTKKDLKILVGVILAIVILIFLGYRDEIRREKFGLKQAASHLTVESSDTLIG